MHDWANRLNEEFKKTGWSVAEFSRRSGVESGNLYKYLDGVIHNPRGDIVEKLAGTLGISPVYLRYGEATAPAIQKEKDSIAAAMGKQGIDYRALESAVKLVHETLVDSGAMVLSSGNTSEDISASIAKAYIHLSELRKGD